MRVEQKGGSSGQPQSLMCNGEVFISRKALRAIILKTPLLEEQRKRLDGEFSQAQGSGGEEITFLPKPDDVLLRIEGTLGIEKEQDTTITAQQRSEHIIAKIGEQKAGIQIQNQGNADFLFGLEDALELKGSEDATTKFDPAVRRSNILGEVVRLAKKKTNLEEEVETLKANLANMADPHETVDAVLESLFSIGFSQLSSSEQRQIFYSLKDLGINFDLK